MYTSPSRTRGPKSSKDNNPPPQTVSWNKTHKLEGDCLISGFYDFLLLRNNETMKPCVDVFIPDTIVYDHNFPRGWYTTDDKSREVMKRQGTDLDSSKVLEYFSKPPSKNVGIVASYMSSHEEEDGTTTTSVEFFNQHTLKEFVERKTKREGILQKFIIPKGGNRNTVIQAVWSPNPNAFFVWRRTNRMNLDHKPQWEKDPYPMCVTYDGPSHYSEEGTCALEIKKKIRSVCEKVVEHFFQVYEKEKVIIRLVLYFKLDENDSDRLWLLWCGGLRVADANSTQIDTSHHTVPLNLAPKYSDSSVEARKENQELDLLEETNKKYRELKKSASAESNSPNKSKSGHHHSHHHGSKSGTGHNSPGYGSPNSTVNNGSRLTGGGGNNNTYDDGSNNNNTRDGKNINKNGDATTAGLDDDDKANNADDKDAFWKKHPPIKAQYEEYCHARNTIISYLDDIFYEAYGHFLRYDPGSFTFEVDKKMASMLGNDPLGEAMAAGGVQKATPSETGMTSIDDEDLCFEIQPKHPNGPVSKIGDAVKKWINTHYDKLIQDLKEEAASLAPPSGIAVAVAAPSVSTSASKPTTSAMNQKQQEEEKRRNAGGDSSEEEEEKESSAPEKKTESEFEM